MTTQGSTAARRIRQHGANGGTAHTAARRIRQLGAYGGTARTAARRIRQHGANRGTARTAARRMRRHGAYGSSARTAARRELRLGVNCGWLWLAGGADEDDKGRDEVIRFVQRWLVGGLQIGPRLSYVKRS